MEYNVNGEVVKIQEGEGIFINTRQLHYNYSQSKKDCRYLCVLVHPMLLCTSPLVEQDYVAPLLTNHAYPYQALRSDSVWGQKICRNLKKIDECRDNPLLIQAAFFQIWSQLYQNAPQPASKPKLRSRNLGILQEMIVYVQKNYQQKLTLEDISQTGSVSKTTCHNIFPKYVNQSPNAYLTEYRLRNGMELLRTTDMTVTEIAFEVGFSGPSYFSESFRTIFGMSPLEYRRRNKREGLL